MSEQPKQPNNDQQQSIVAEIKKALSTNKEVSINDLFATLKSRGLAGDLQVGDLNNIFNKIKATELPIENDSTKISEKDDGKLGVQADAKGIEKAKAPAEDPKDAVKADAKGAEKADDSIKPTVVNLVYQGAVNPGHY